MRRYPAVGKTNNDQSYQGNRQANPDTERSNKFFTVLLIFCQKKSAENQTEKYQQYIRYQYIFEHLKPIK